LTRNLPTSFQPGVRRLTVRNAIICLIGLIILSFGGASALAHPPVEHEPAAASQEMTETADDPEQSDHQDDPNAPPHDHPTTAVEPTVIEEAGPPHDQATEHHADAPSDDPGDVQAHEHGEGEEHVTAPCGGADDHHGAAGDEPQEGHSHWGEDGPKTPFERALAKLGVFHALAVHFPIALILAAALAQALNIARKDQSYSDVVRFLVWTGALGGLVAGFFGWAHAGPMASDEAGVMFTHRWLGTALALGLFAVAAAVEWRRQNPSAAPSLVLNFSLFGAAAAVALNGFLGGSLAHGGLRHLMGG